MNFSLPQGTSDLPARNVSLADKNQKLMHFVS